MVDKFIQDNNVENNVILELSQQAKVNTRKSEQSDLKLTKIMNNIDLRLIEAKKSNKNENYKKYKMNKNERNEQTNDKNKNKKENKRENKNDNKKYEEIEKNDECEENTDNSNYDDDVDSTEDEREEYSCSGLTNSQIANQTETSNDDQDSSKSDTTLNTVSDVSELKSQGFIPSKHEIDESSISTTDEYELHQF